MAPVTREGKNTREPPSRLVIHPRNQPALENSLPMSYEIVRTSGHGCKMSVLTSYDMGTLPQKAWQD
eukprot:9720058-Karenia_brevis.AAC.1